MKQLVVWIGSIAAIFMLIITLSAGCCDSSSSQGATVQREADSQSQRYLRVIAKDNFGRTIGKWLSTDRTVFLGSGEVNRVNFYMKRIGEQASRETYVWAPIIIVEELDLTKPQAEAMFATHPGYIDTETMEPH